jgi:hypothetical protein
MEFNIGSTWNKKESEAWVEFVSRVTEASGKT